MIRNIDPAWQHYYNASFLNGAHQLLAWGYEDALPKIDAEKEEEEITGFIVKAMRQRLNNPLTPNKFRRYHVSEDDHVRNSTRTGKRRQRIDIVIMSSQYLPRPEFMFEAKILRKNGFPISEYTGDGGMQCYIKCEYAVEYPVAAMIGYLQSDDPNRWFQELKRKFDEDSDKLLRITASLSKQEILACLPNEWVSTHNRNNNTDIKIFHIFLDCSQPVPQKSETTQE